jgi:hypothetical protein
MGVSPAFARPQAASGDTSSDTTKKAKKGSKKSEATESVAEPASAAPAPTPGASTPEANPTNTTASTTAAAPKKIKTASGNSSSEIAAAQASGKVWVNLDSGIYHKGGRWYGKTKNGKFMTEAEAKAAGYKESKRN